jgi:DNA-directed RNA polymerase subunit RPC12/RpoP
MVSHRTATEGTGEGIWCADCEKEFKNDNVYRSHLTGKKHIRFVKDRIWCSRRATARSLRLWAKDVPWDADGFSSTGMGGCAGWARPHGSRASCRRRIGGRGRGDRLPNLVLASCNCALLEAMGQRRALGCRWFLIGCACCLSGPATEGTGEGIWCADCEKEFKNDNVYRSHLTGGHSSRIEFGARVVQLRAP